MENYVVLEPGEKEQILSSEETLAWLIDWLGKMEELPKDLKEKNSIKAAANHLLETACDLEIRPGFTLQWFAVRLESPYQ